MKLTKHAWIIWGILLTVVIVLMVLIPFNRTAVWWIGAACTVGMFGLCAYIYRAAFRRGRDLFSKLLGWPLFKVSVTGLIVQLVLGFLLMGIASFCPAWVAILAEVLMYAAVGVCLTAKDAAREIVVQSEIKAEDRTAAWKKVRARAQAIAASSDNAELKKLAEEIRYADPTPTSMDARIEDMIAALSVDVDAAVVQQALRLVEQRKVLAKEEKKVKRQLI